MSDFLPLLLLVAVGTIAFLFSQTKFSESRLSLWAGDVATLIMMGWCSVLVASGRLSSAVELGAAFVFLGAAAIGFWHRFSSENRDRPD